MTRELGKMEMAQAISNEEYAFNAVIVLSIKGGPKEETMRTLLDYLQKRYPLLGVHIVTRGNRWFFETEGTPQIPLNVIKRENNRQWFPIVEQEMDRKFDLFSGPLVRFTYLTGTGKQSQAEIIITFQHSIMDAVSGEYLLHEVLSFCQEIESKGAIEKLECLESLPMLPPVEAFFPPSFKGWRQKWKIFSFIIRQMSDEIGFRIGTKGKRIPPVHSQGKNKILPIKLSKEVTTSLLQLCYQKRLSINNLLNAVFLSAVHKQLYSGDSMPFRHINTVNLRPYLKPPLENHHLGSYFTMMRSTIGLKKNETLWDLARRFNDITYKSLKRGDKYCSNLLSYRMMRMMFRLKSIRMSNTALSYTGHLKLKKQYGELEVRDVHAFPSNFVVGPEFSALAKIFNDQIYWDFLYLDSDMDENRAKTIADEVCASLETAAQEL